MRLISGGRSSHISTPPSAERAATSNVPDDVDGPGADLGVLAHDADAGREGAVDAEHHRLRLGWQHRQEEVHRRVVAPAAAETSSLHSDNNNNNSEHL